MLEYLRHCYMEANTRHRRLFVYHLHGKGLFLELRRLANAMIYAMANGLQLVVDGTDFAYKIRDGWTDYFDPCFPLYSPAMEPNVERHLLTDRDADQNLVRAVFWPAAASIRIGNIELHDLEAMKKLFALIAFKLNDTTTRRVAEITSQLRLPRHYSAIQVRRGEKMTNGEGEYHAAELYLEKLRPLDPESGIFVMSDDYAAVREVREYVTCHELPNRIYTLVTDQHAGNDFQVFMREVASNDADAFVYPETLRLLAETSIVTGADRFVGAWDTNVAHGLRYLHPNPHHCTLL